MHHSVLPEEGGTEPRGRLSSSRRALAREDRVAKRNPELARAGSDRIVKIPSISMRNQSADLLLCQPGDFRHEAWGEILGKHFEGELAFSVDLSL